MSTTFGESLVGRRARLALGALCSLLFVGSVGWILFLGAKRPFLNFDMVDYVALTLEWVEPDPVVVHRRTYEILRAELPPAVFENFTTGDTPTPGGPFRERIARDWESFHENLGYHRGRYLYTLAVLGVHALGVPLTAATAWPNLVFWPLTAILVLVWARRHFAAAPAALLALGILLSPPVLHQVPASSPDSMAMFLLALALYLVSEHRAFGWGMGFLTLTMLVRPDFVLVCGGIGVALYLLVERDRRPSTLILASWLFVCAGLYLTISRLAGDPGWWAAFLSVERRVGRFDEVIPFKPWYYVLGMRERLRSMHYAGYDTAADGSFVSGSNFVLTYGAAALVGLTLALRSRIKGLEVHMAVLAGLALGTAVRIAVFPNLWDRYFVYLWVPVPLCLASMCAVLVARARERPEAES